MDIAYEGRFLTKEPRGIGVYSREILSHLLKQNSDHHFHVLLNGPVQLWHEWLLEQSHVTLIPSPPMNFVRWECVYLPQQLKQIPTQILHMVGNTVPLWGLPKQLKLLVTLHDVIFWENREWGAIAYQNFGKLYRRFNTYWAASHYDHVLTVSEYSKQKIIEVLSVPETDITVTYNGYEHLHHEAGGIEALSSLGVESKRFWFHLGGDALTKRTEMVIEAYVQWSHLHSERIPLVIAGVKNPEPFKERFPEHQDLLVFTGFLEVQSLNLLYQHCLGFLYFSQYEGFGIPLLEAMQYQTPLIVSRTSCLPEIVGDHGVMIQSTSDAVAAMQKVWECPEDYHSQASPLFSWEVSARRTLEVYNQM